MVGRDRGRTTRATSSSSLSASGADDFAFSETDDDDEPELTLEDVSSMTVVQLKQQLRLRGLKVTGRKRELIDRLSSACASPYRSPVDVEIVDDGGGGVREHDSEALRFAKENGKELIDVTAYVEKDETEEKEKDSEANNQKENDETEVWGDDARVSADLNVDNPVVDGLSRTVIEYKGPDGARVDAFAVASRDALRRWMSGGKAGDGDGDGSSSSSEERVRTIQEQREKAARVPRTPDPNVDEGADDPEAGMREQEPLERDHGDWGIMSPTGARLSAREIPGVLVLSDVYGPYTEHTKALCEKIAFE